MSSSILLRHVCNTAGHPFNLAYQNLVSELTTGPVPTFNGCRSPPYLDKRPIKHIQSVTSDRSYLAKLSHGEQTGCRI